MPTSAPPYLGTVVVSEISRNNTIVEFGMLQYGHLYTPRQSEVIDAKFSRITFMLSARLGIHEQAST